MLLHIYVAQHMLEMLLLLQLHLWKYGILFLKTQSKQILFAQPSSLVSHIHIQQLLEQRCLSGGNYYRVAQIRVAQG